MAAIAWEREALVLVAASGDGVLMETLRGSACRKLVVGVLLPLPVVVVVVVAVPEPVPLDAAKDRGAEFEAPDREPGRSL